MRILERLTLFPLNKLYTCSDSDSDSDSDSSFLSSMTELTITTLAYVISVVV